MASTGGVTVPRRSIDIGKGRRTSVSVEDDFWEEFCLIAQSREMSVSALVVEVKQQKRPVKNLSRAIRTYVLQHMKGRLQASAA
jgi:predicted DNA-binding ribbon-helix-helix protein